jgi:hypothetical protein
MYDPALARWHVIDPLADFMPTITPYSYALNNPITYVDVYGLGPVDWWRKVKDFTMTKVLGFQKHGSYSAGNVYFTKNKGNKYNPSFATVTPHEPGSVARPYRGPVGVKQEPLPKPAIAYEGPEAVKQEPIPIETFYDYLEENLTGNPQDFAGNFGSRPAHHDAYISRNKEQLNRYIKDLVTLINNRQYIKVKIVVGTAYEKDQAYTKDLNGNPDEKINIYTAPGVSKIGTSTDLVNERGNYMRQQLINRGVPANKIAISKPQFGTTNSVDIVVNYDF